ncbi:hypothetical protein ACXET9_04720 [Brachybacterium sp. DNPG3]
MNHPYPYTGDQSSIRTSAIILIIVGAVCGGMIPTIFGIIALVQLDTNPASARQMNKVGWIVFWVLLAISVLAIIAYIAFMVLMFGVFSIPVITGG